MTLPLRVELDIDAFAAVPLLVLRIDELVRLTVAFVWIVVVWLMYGAVGALYVK